MGKGKGNFLRWAVKLNRGYILIEFKGISFLLVKKINKKLAYTLGVTTFIKHKTIREMY
jgi:ribosomal protein L16/L10AE